MNLPPAKSPSDQSLLKDYVERGSGDAFAILVRRYQGMVYEAIKTRAGDPDTVRDILQEVFLVLAIKAPVLLEHPAIPAWLVRTATLEVKKRNRSECNRHRRERRYEEAKSIRQNRFSEAEFRAVENALDELPRDYRVAIRLRYHQQKSFEEIAEILGRTPGATQRLISRAIEKLRDFLDQGDDDGGLRRGTAVITILSILGAMSLPTAKGAPLQPAGTGPATPPPRPRWMPTPTQWMIGCAASGIVALGLIWWATRPPTPPQLATVSTPLPTTRSASPPPPGDRPSATARGSTLSAEADFLIQRMLDIHLATDSFAVEEIRLRIFSLDPSQLAGMLDMLDHVNAEGRPMVLLREMMIRRLAQSDPRQATIRAHQTRNLQTAAVALRLWAARDPWNAVDWYLERRQAGEIWSPRLWRKYDGNLVGATWNALEESADYDGGPLPANPLRASYGEMEPNDLLASSLFEGLAGHGPDLIATAFQRLPPEDLPAAIQGVARYCWKHRSDERFMRLVAPARAHISDAQCIGLFARMLPAYLADFGNCFMAVAAMLRDHRVDQAASDEILATLAKRAGAYAWDDIHSWLSQRFDSLPADPLLGDILSAWAAHDPYATASWLQSRTDWPPAQQWAGTFVEHASNHGSGVPRETAESIASAISHPPASQQALECIRQGRFDLALPTPNPPVHITIRLPSGRRTVTAIHLPAPAQPFNLEAVLRFRERAIKSIQQSLENPEISRLDVTFSYANCERPGWLRSFWEKLLHPLAELPRQTTLPPPHSPAGLETPTTIPEMLNLIEQRLQLLSNPGFVALLERSHASGPLHPSRIELDRIILESTALRVWFAKDPAAALEWAANPSPEAVERVRMLRLYVIHAAAQSDFPSALRLARELPPLIGHSYDPLTFLAGAPMSTGSRRELVEFALSLPSAHRDAILAAIGRSILMRHGFPAARQFHEALPHPATEIHAMRLAIATQALERDAPTKAAWLLEHSTEPFLMVDFQVLVTRWLDADCPAFLDWVEDLPPGPIRSRALRHAAVAIATVEPTIARQWADLIDDPKLLQETLRVIDLQSHNR